uniref:Capsid protein n=1 Tax=Foveavirus mali TaxID=35350 RepID=A0A0S1YF29_9VIRU|nr:coat protein [Apple stem pitting virus]
MASNGSSPPASTPMVSAEGPAAAVSAPSSSVAVSAPVSEPAASEPVISQVQSYIPETHCKWIWPQSPWEVDKCADEAVPRRGSYEGLRRRVPPESAHPAHHNCLQQLCWYELQSFRDWHCFQWGSPNELGILSNLPWKWQCQVNPALSAYFLFSMGWVPLPMMPIWLCSKWLLAVMVERLLLYATELQETSPQTLVECGGVLTPYAWETYDMRHRRGVVASNQKIKAVGVALIGMGIPEHQLTEVGVYLARHCADVGASDKSTLLGTFPGSDITLEEVGTMIKQTEGCTLRQYCAFYAKQVWNLMLAAFDFFFGVESTAALEPADGLIRLPTQAERVANATSKEIQMYRIRSMEGTQAVNFGEVFWGKIGPKPVLSIRK